jgi:hypothetical protein
MACAVLPLSAPTAEDLPAPPLAAEPGAAGASPPASWEMVVEGLLEVSSLAPRESWKTWIGRLGLT